MTSKALIIPAAGSGTRMQREIPKPYLKLSGIPILERTIRQFVSLDGLQQVVVASPEECLDEAKQILDSVLPDPIAGQAIIGGVERQQSIQNALCSTDEVDLVLVHDAVRPFVKLKQIEACCRAAADAGAAVLGIPAQDTIKSVDADKFVKETPSRSVMWQAQTPQVFKKSVLTQAYEFADQNNFTGTDDACLVERAEMPVKMVEGDRTNFKLTYPLDLELAQVILNKKKD